MTAINARHSRWARRRLGRWRKETLVLDEIGHININTLHQLGLSRSNLARRRKPSFDWTEAMIWYLLSIAP
jgi:hypothetical protein